MKINNAVLRAISALLLGTAAAVAWIVTVALFVGLTMHQPDDPPPPIAVAVAGIGALLAMPGVCILAFMLLTPRAPQRKYGAGSVAARNSVPGAAGIVASPTTPPTTLPPGLDFRNGAPSAATAPFVPTGVDDPEDSASVTFSLSAREWTDSVTFFARRSPMRRQVRWFLGLIAVCAVGLINYQSLAAAPAAASTWVEVAVTLCLIGVYVALMSLGIRWWERRGFARLTRYPCLETKLVPRTLTVTRDALLLQSSFVMVRCPWRLIWEILETQQFLFFIASPSEFELVPWSAFPSESHAAHFVALARQYHAGEPGQFAG